MLVVQCGGQKCCCFSWFCNYFCPLKFKGCLVGNTQIYLPAICVIHKLLRRLHLNTCLLFSNCTLRAPVIHPTSSIVSVALRSLRLFCRRSRSDYGSVPYSPSSGSAIRMLIMLEGHQLCFRICTQVFVDFFECVCMRRSSSAMRLRVSFRDQKRNDTWQQSLYIRPAGQLERAVLVMEDCRNWSKSDCLRRGVAGPWIKVL